LKDPVKTKIREGGLRYQSKTVGSEFSGPFGGSMSCILCGKHMPRSRLASVVLGGRHQVRCRDGC
jgi:hypothetical protein